MERTTWTDERLDERMAAIDNTFDRIFEELHELRLDLRELRADFNRFQDRMIQIGFGMVAVLTAQLITAIVALT